MNATIRLLTRATLAWAAVAVSVHSALAQNQYQYQGAFTSTTLQYGKRIAVDSQGNTVVSVNAALYVFNAKGTQVSSTSMIGSGAMYFGGLRRAYAANGYTIQVFSSWPNSFYQTDVVSPKPTVSDMVDVAADTDDSLVVLSGATVKRIVGTKFVQTLGAVGPGVEQLGGIPTSMELDSRTSNIFVTDPGKSRVAVYDKWGNFVQAITDGTQSFNPADIAIKNDRLYIVNRARDTVDVYNTSGNFITSIGANPSPGEPVLSAPAAVAVDDSGRVLVLCPTQNAVRTYIPRDTTAPVSALTTNPSDAVNNWVATDVTATIKADDGFLGLGVQEIRYKINGASAVQPGSTAAFTRFTEGVYQVEYQSVDIAGNSEAIKTAMFGIDRTPPVTQYQFTTDKRWLDLFPNDALSGVYGTAYQLDDNDPQVYDPEEGIALDGGNHTVYWLSTDIAGNGEQMRQVSVSGSKLVGLYTTPYDVMGGGAMAFTATLDKPAPGGALVTLWFGGSDFDFIEIAPGKSSGTLVYDNAPEVDVVTPVTFYGLLGSDSFVEGRFTLYPQMIAMTIAPRDLMPGGVARAKVGLLSTHRMSNLTVTSSSPDVVVPQKTAWNGGGYNQGYWTSSFSLRVLPTAKSGTVTITAQCDEQTVSMDVYITAYELEEAVFNPGEIGWGGTTSVEVSINGPAPPGGIKVQLTPSHSYLKCPTTLTIPAGETTGAASVQYVGTYQGQVWVSANLDGKIVKAILNVRSPKLVEVYAVPDIVIGGTSLKVTAQLDGNAASALSWGINADLPSVVKTGVMTVAKGKPTGLATLTTYAVGRPTPVTITLLDWAGPVSTTVTVMPVNVAAVKVTTPTIRQGGSSVVTVSLAKSAGVDTIVNLTTTTSGVVQIPSTITVPKGKSSVTFTATGLSTSSRKTTEIRAETDGNYKGATITVNP